MTGAPVVVVVAVVDAAVVVVDAAVFVVDGVVVVVVGVVVVVVAVVVVLAFVVVVTCGMVVFTSALNPALGEPSFDLNMTTSLLSTDSNKLTGFTPQQNRYPVRVQSSPFLIST